MCMPPPPQREAMRYGGTSASSSPPLPLSGGGHRTHDNNDCISSDDSTRCQWACHRHNFSFEASAATTGGGGTSGSISPPPPRLTGGCHRTHAQVQPAQDEMHRRRWSDTSTLSEESDSLKFETMSPTGTEAQGNKRDCN